MSRCLLFKAEFPGSASQSSGSLVIMAVSLVFPFMTYNLSPHTRIPAPQSLRIFLLRSHSLRRPGGLDEVYRDRNVGTPVDLRVPHTFLQIEEILAHGHLIQSIL